MSERCPRQPRSSSCCSWGNAARSLNAIRLVRQVARAQTASAAALRVVDIEQQPGVEAHYRVLATPTLVRTSGGSERRLVGELSEQNVLDYFEVENDGH